MSLVSIESLGELGIITDTPPYDIPQNAWSGGNNVRVLDSGIKKIRGYGESLKTITFAPYYVMPYETAAGVYYWLAFGVADIAVWDGTGWTDITRQTTTTLDGAITDVATTITLTNASDFPTSGTIAIGSKQYGSGNTNYYEEIPYTGKSSNDLTGCTRGGDKVAHDDDAVVTPISTTSTTDSDYAANGNTRRWSVTNLNGLLVATNGYDAPQMWPLNSAGVPLKTVPFRELQNWPSQSAVTAGGSNNTCQVIRSFRTFLVGLNWSNVQERGIKEPRLVKWSTEASYGTAPVTWDRADATLDAGEYELADTPGAIIDGLPLGDSFLIYKNDSIYVMNYVGTPYIFSFKLLSPTVGALCKNSVVDFELGHFFIGNSNFYLCNGQTVQPLLTGRLRRGVFDEIVAGDVSDPSWQKSFAVVDHVHKEILACYPTQDSSIVNKAVIWNWEKNTFTFRDLPNLSHASVGILEASPGGKLWGAQAVLNVASMTPSSPADGGALTVVSTTATPAFTSTGTLVLDDEEITYTGTTSTTFTGITRGANSTTAAAHDNSIMVNQVTDTWNSDSEAWGSSAYDSHLENLVFADVTNTKFYRDNSGNQEDGSNMTAYIERTGYDLGDPSTVKFVSAVYPQIEVPGDNSVNIYIGHQMSSEEGVTWEGPTAFNPNSQSKVSCRVSGKYFGVKVESTTDVDWRLHGLAFNVVPRGNRGSRMQT